jgi:hypothetical protein
MAWDISESSAYYHRPNLFIPPDAGVQTVYKTYLKLQANTGTSDLHTYSMFLSNTNGIKSNFAGACRVSLPYNATGLSAAAEGKLGLFVKTTEGEKQLSVTVNTTDKRLEAWSSYLGTFIIRKDAPAVENSISNLNKIVRVQGGVIPLQFAVTLSEASQVRASVLDISGREPKVLVENYFPAGTINIQWDGNDSQGHPVSTGVYLLKLEIDDTRVMKLFVLAR